MSETRAVLSDSSAILSQSGNMKLAKGEPLYARHVVRKTTFTSPIVTPPEADKENGRPQVNIMDNTPSSTQKNNNKKKKTIMPLTPGEQTVTPSKWQNEYWGVPKRREGLAAGEGSANKKPPLKGQICSSGQKEEAPTFLTAYSKSASMMEESPVLKTPSPMSIALLNMGVIGSGSLLAKTPSPIPTIKINMEKELEVEIVETVKVETKQTVYHGIDKLKKENEKKTNEIAVTTFTTYPVRERWAKAMKILKVETHNSVAMGKVVFKGTDKKIIGLLSLGGCLLSFLCFLLFSSTQGAGKSLGFQVGEKLVCDLNSFEEAMTTKTEVTKVMSSENRVSEWNTFMDSMMAEPASRVISNPVETPSVSSPWDRFHEMMHTYYETEKPTLANTPPPPVAAAAASAFEINTVHITDTKELGWNVEGPSVAAKESVDVLVILDGEIRFKSGEEGVEMDSETDIMLMLVDLMPIKGSGLHEVGIEVGSRTDQEYFKSVTASFYYDGIEAEENVEEGTVEVKHADSETSPPQLFIVSPAQGEVIDRKDDLNIVFATKTYLANSPGEEIPFDGKDDHYIELFLDSERFEVPFLSGDIQLEGLQTGPHSMVMRLMQGEGRFIGGYDKVDFVIDDEEAKQAVAKAETLRLEAEKEAAALKVEEADIIHQLEIGDIVTTHSLKTERFNDLTGTILSFNKDTNRFTVEVKLSNDNENKLLALKGSNLKVPK